MRWILKNGWLFSSDMIRYSLVYVAAGFSGPPGYKFAGMCAVRPARRLCGSGLRHIPGSHPGSYSRPPSCDVGMTSARAFERAWKRWNQAAGVWKPAARRLNRRHAGFRRIFALPTCAVATHCMQKRNRRPGLTDQRAHARRRSDDFFEQRRQTARTIERGQVIVTADMCFADENLRHLAAARAGHHFLAARRILVDQHFLDLVDAARLQQTLGHLAIRAHLRAVHDH